MRTTRTYISTRRRPKHWSRNSLQAYVLPDYSLVTSWFSALGTVISTLLFLAIVGAGGVVCGANPAYHFLELDHIVRQSKPRFFITTENILPTVLDVCKGNCIPQDCVFLVDASQGLPADTDLDRAEVDGVLPRYPKRTSVRLLNELLVQGKSKWITCSGENAMKSTVAAYYPTSGTTGLPKLAVVSHYNLIIQHLSLHDNQTLPHEVVRLASLPFFHIFGAAWAFIAPIRYGQPVYIMPRFNMRGYTENIHKYAITETYMAPPMVHTLNKRALSEPGFATLLTSLRYVGIGGAPIDIAALRALRSTLHSQATVTQVWGMTEFGPAALFRYGENDDTGSVGRLLPGYEPRVVPVGTSVFTDTEVTLTEGAGDLYIRTPALMDGYRGIPMSSGVCTWFYTGDIAYVADGKLCLVGRSKEMIKVRGWQVAPAELESVILQLESVTDCAVVGVTTIDGLEETPRAYVVPKDQGENQAELEAEIQRAVQEQLASYKRLGGGIIFVGSIPRTASGKIQRFRLLASK
ncbi:AMP-binding enzyme [Diaporthe helianthi]|uniref:AMP-binding enzyme n=1 Tax=Diaporthe helianthi TaxID=158607 RepID=A0A2P5HGW3_DIAHE|nr:AMP-binding enzyme [Diaporthe helianthi]